jgi:cysteinyl-tRNA synthetase
MALTVPQQQQQQQQQQLHLFNSLTLQKDPFQPLHPQKVSMYTCGPTVYDYAHVGNFRAFLTYDVLKRTLQYFGYHVDHVCNLTDVDDKIIKKVSGYIISTFIYTELSERNESVSQSVSQTVAKISAMDPSLITFSTFGSVQN